MFTPLTSLCEPEVLADPYPYYARLRAEAPVVRDPLGVWFVSRYEDVSTLLHHPAAQCDRLRAAFGRRADGGEPEVALLCETLRRFFVFLDPPEHTRLRALVSKAFTPRRVLGMRERIQRRVDALLDRAVDKGHLDVIEELAVPLPVAVICDMLEVPAEDGPALKLWSNDVATIIGRTGTTSHEDVLRIARSVREYMDYFQRVLEERRRHLGDDLLSALIQAQDAGDSLPATDVCATAVMLMFAGHETTTNLIGNGFLALLRDGSARERLRRAPQLWATALDELLRFDSPVQFSVRFLSQELEIAGQRLPANALVHLLLGAANHDPARFEQPDRLDLARAHNRHLSFGHGPHFCIGAALARLEGELALRGLLARCQNMQLRDAEPLWRPNPAFRGLLRLPLG